MQKDFHFYVTFALAMTMGVPRESAIKVAWANQYTDDCQEADLYGIQTQSALLGNWDDTQIQFSVLVPFHFIPGDDPAHKWTVTPNCTRAKALLKQATNEYELGIALHVLQDTFSHQGFSGWAEPVNSCYPWYYLQAQLPNVGHAEMGVVPDVTHYVWTDPRTGQRVDNADRALGAAIATDTALALCFGVGGHSCLALESTFRHHDYDERKTKLRHIAGIDVSYNTIHKSMDKAAFIQAARTHLQRVIKML